MLTAFPYGLRLTTTARAMSSEDGGDEYTLLMLEWGPVLFPGVCTVADRPPEQEQGVP